MENNLFVDIACVQRNCLDEHICGDTYIVKKSDGGGSAVAVLADGLGHGVKANILSTLTATFIVNYDHHIEDIKRIAEFVLKTLPICSVRNMRYSTFSRVSIDLFNRKATIIEYDNPTSIIYRRGRELECEWKSVQFESNIDNHESICYTTFEIEEGDRIITMTDGVTQSGLGSKKYPFGWKRERVVDFIINMLEEDSKISSNNIASRVVEQAMKIDDYYAKDDISCLCATISLPKNTLLCASPPVEAKMGEFVDFIDSFEGKKVVCGYHLARLISAVNGATIESTLELSDYTNTPELQPIWYMSGVDFVTESLVTLNKLYFLLQTRPALDDESHLKNKAAFKLYRLMLESESITFLLGLVHESGGEYSNSEYELRRKIMCYISDILEEKFHKKVKVLYK